jgi:arginyl-tRNA synthetase
MFKEELKEIILKAIKAVFPEAEIEEIEIQVEHSKISEYDYSSNVGFILAKKLGQSPDKITEALFDYLFNNWPTKLDQIGYAPSVSGYLNFKLREKFYAEELKKILREKDHYGDSKILDGQKIQVEFISANPTGPLTLANGRGGFGGDALANVLTKAGAKVEREYLVNDGGNQVRVLGEAILVAAGLRPDSEDVYHGEYLAEWVEKNREQVEKLKDKPQDLGTLAADDILANLIKPAVVEMKIGFDNWFSERKLIESGEVDQALADFKKKGLTYEEDNALWFKTTQYNDDKDRVLKKADGENTYFANDAAYHWDKFYERKFDRVINLWGADHHGYVGRMMAAVEAMGYKNQLEVIIMQLVRLIQDGQEVRMSKRKGNYITMKDLFIMIGGPTEEASDVARFFFLSRAFNTHMDFDLNLAREHSEKNPVFYVKYAYARISGILRNAKNFTFETHDSSLLADESELALIKELTRITEIVESVATDKSYPIHFLTFYAQDIATKFHSFYDKCRVIDETDLELTAARLKLVEATQIVLGIVMRDLIGIDTPEKM